MLNASNLPRSIALANGRKVTTRSTSGGIGEGLLIQGFVYKSGGNGFYQPDAGLDAYLLDDGEGYRRVIRALNVSLLDDADWQRCEALDEIRREVAAENAEV